MQVMVGIATAIVAGATVVYAYLTWQLAESAAASAAAAREAAEVAEEVLARDVLPIVVGRTTSRTSGRWQVSLTNLGRGPALNVVVWILWNDERVAEAESRRVLTAQRAEPPLGAGETRSGPAVAGPEAVADGEDLAVVCEYTDISGQAFRCIQWEYGRRALRTETFRQRGAVWKSIAPASRHVGAEGGF